MSMLILSVFVSFGVKSGDELLGKLHFKRHSDSSSKTRTTHVQRGEVQLKKDTRNFGETDSDRDGLTNAQEGYIGTDPFNPDTDGDGVIDGDEVKKGSNPLKPDANSAGGSFTDYDRDGLFQFDEEIIYGTDPLNPDTDGDGIRDNVELGIGPVISTNGTTHVTSDPLDPCDPNSLNCATIQTK